MDNSNNYKHLISGGLAGLFSRTLTAPLDRLKIHYQVNFKGKKTPPVVEGLRQLHAKDGFSGYFKGNAINIFKNVPDTAIRLFVFEKARDSWCSKPHSTTDLLGCGAVAALAATCIVFPFDVVKVKLQAAPKGTFDSLADTVNQIYSKRGVLGFYKGIQTSMLQNIPTNGLNLMIYQTLKDRFGVNSLGVLSYLVFGGISSFISSSLIYPVGTLQSRIIIEDVPTGKGIIRTFREIKRTEGGRSFYKGYTPGLAKVVLGNMIAFTVFETTKRVFNI